MYVCVRVRVYETEREREVENLFSHLDERLTSCGDNHIGDTYTTWYHVIGFSAFLVKQSTIR